MTNFRCGWKDFHVLLQAFLALAFENRRSAERTHLSSAFYARVTYRAFYVLVAARARLGASSDCGKGPKLTA